MDILKRFTRVFFITLICVAMDQGTKLLASLHLPKEKMISYLGGIFRIGYTENIGAFLGLGNQLSAESRFWLLVVIVGLFLLALLAYLIFNSKQEPLSLVALSLVFAGGLSNFYDRITNNGAVIDFLNLGVGSIRTGVFNIADIAIMLGAALLIFTVYQEEKLNR